MPEEEKAELGSNGKLVKEIYFDNEVVDKFWIEGSKAYYGKPEKGMLGTLVYNDCCDERVILLIGSDCGTEDSIMKGEVFSEGSDRISVKPMARSMVLRERKNGGGSDDAKVLGGKNHEEEDNKLYEGQQHKDKVAEGTNTMEVSRFGESKSQEDNVVHNLETEKTENVIAFGEREVQESINCHQQFPGCLPYSGSISLRSTSSTASAQSFAFPVLAEEWNSSPVRMAKADKKQLRKQKGWVWKMKVGWFCCRF